MQRKVDARNKRKRIKEERRRNGEQVSDTDSESEPDLYHPISPAEFSDSDQDPPQGGGVNGGASTAIAVWSPSYSQHLTLVTRSTEIWSNKLLPGYCTNDIVIIFV